MSSETPDRDAGEPSMKVVGHRRWGHGLVASARLLKLVVELRGTRPFIPKGVHRFHSFEESEEWTLRMLARPPRPAPRS